jgi:hypothetical protein
MEKVVLGTSLLWTSDKSCWNVTRKIGNNCREHRVYPLSSFPKSQTPHSRPQVADHLVPNRILGLFEFREKERGGRGLFSKACKSLYRHRFKEIEDAPLVATIPPSFQMRF